MHILLKKHVILNFLFISFQQLITILEELELKE